MIKPFNFHTHSAYDDGKETLEDYVKAAVDKGFAAIGFSGHSPLPFDNEWSIQKSDYADYLAEGRRLKEKYKDHIPVYLGLEIDYVPGHSDRFSDFVEGAGLDYCIGSVHLVMKPGSKDPRDIWFIDGPREGYLEGIDTIYGGDARAATEAYYAQLREMVITQRPDIIGHLDKVAMHSRGEVIDTNARWYRDAVNDLLDAIASAGTIVEVNTRGTYTGKSEYYYPEEAILAQCLQKEIPVMVNSDAHHPSQLDKGFNEAVHLLQSMGFQRMRTPFFDVSLR